ncbi:hypothetical protein ACHAWU_007087 [Discostella pseudostelligera]|uniref:Uncharacterized protein n=1 Tax=Discostella pseudostelligera TaxID=259834 RepID=A0ABD3N6I9_9STRA
MNDLNNRLSSFEVTRRQQPRRVDGGGKGKGKGGSTATADATKATRTISWKENDMVVMHSHDDNGSGGSGGINNDNNNKPPPIGRIKFSCLPTLPPPEHNGGKNYAVAHTSSVAPRSQQSAEDAESDKNIGNGDDQSSSSTSTSTSTASEGGIVAFSGWARVFFQARHHRSATLLTPFGGMTPWSQDTYLYISIIHYTTDNEDGLRVTSMKKRNANELHICAAAISYLDPIPGSHSGAALFLRNDDRKLRKYIFRFEFVNKCVHQSPARYANFIRSGRVAKKSMSRYRGAGSKLVNKLTSAARKGGPLDAMNDTTKREKEAYEAHLSALDELLRESSELADRFVEVVNDLNEKEEEEENYWREMMKGGGGGEAKKRTKPPPPYWGSGFNIKQTGNNEEDEKEESDSDYSGDEDEDDILNYDDDNDDETLFDRVQVSTEQTLEALFNHIVK